MTATPLTCSFLALAIFTGFLQIQINQIRLDASATARTDNESKRFDEASLRIPAANMQPRMFLPVADLPAGRPLTTGLPQSDEDRASGQAEYLDPYDLQAQYAEEAEPRSIGRYISPDDITADVDKDVVPRNVGRYIDPTELESLGYTP